MARQSHRWDGTTLIGLRFSNIMVRSDYERFPTFWDDPIAGNGSRGSVEGSTVSASPPGLRPEGDRGSSGDTWQPARIQSVVGRAQANHGRFPIARAPAWFRVRHRVLHPAQPPARLEPRPQSRPRRRRDGERGRIHEYPFLPVCPYGRDDMRRVPCCRPERSFSGVLQRQSPVECAGIAVRLRGKINLCADYNRTFPVLLRLLQQRPDPTGMITTAQEVQT